ncbi:hypothetical protein J6590_015586 [Homalodisca vitripennis]|nr:hypothetical protein J6590_015586 [Homalodisca vitripennis]
MIECPERDCRKPVIYKERKSWMLYFSDLDRSQRKIKYSDKLWFKDTLEVRIL